MPARKGTSGKSLKERRGPAVDELEFEEAFRELEAIVAQLEGDGQSLEDLLALYERGQQLAARCSAQLDDAELRVQRLHQGGAVPLTLDDDAEA
jgi:exodeoxyribonuclease VII small subunit